MKTAFPYLIILFVIILSSCTWKSDSDNLKQTTVSFKDSSRHYYPIPQGKDLNVTFFFTNTGEHPLMISEVQSSCGCAKVKYTDRPLEPGTEGNIEVAYDSYKNIGYSQVFITVIMNTAPVKMHTLIFDVNIVPEEYTMTDYEKTYKRQKDMTPLDELNKLVEGDETEKGYFIDSTEAFKY
ncbi:MAG: DUF1573 domain-containing protein [Chitinophagaceae bacterium]|nr:DUF1573 domain-containing protein [Chitinophagaceae bacterium]